MPDENKGEQWRKGDSVGKPNKLFIYSSVRLLEMWRGWGGEGKEHGHGKIKSILIEFTLLWGKMENI
jgi:hypothetical protein